MCLECTGGMIRDGVAVGSSPDEDLLIFAHFCGR